MGFSSVMLKNVTMLTLGNLAMRGVSMFFQVWLAEELGPAGLGLLQLIMTVHGFAITFGTFGLRVAAMVMSAEQYGLGQKDGVRQAMTACLFWGCLISSGAGLLLICLSTPISLHWIRDLRAAPSLRLLGLGLPLTCLGTIAAGFFTACGKVRWWLAVELGDRLLTVALTAGLLSFRDGDLSHACLSITAGGLLSSVGSTALLLWLMFHFLGPKKAQAPSMGRRLRQLCVPVALSDLLRSGLGTLEQFLIPYGFARYGGSHAAAMASYGTIQGMVFPVLMFPCTLLISLSELLVPELARCAAQKDHRRRDRLTGGCLQLGGLYAAGVSGLLFVTAEPLCRLLYDSAEAGRYLKLFSPMVLMLYLDCITDGMHKGLGQQLWSVRVNTLTAFLDVVFLYLLLPRYGLGGFVLTFLITHLINFLLSIGRLLRITDCRLSLGNLLLAVLCVGGAAGVTLSLPQLPGWGGLLAAAAVYLSLSTLCLVLLSSQMKTAPSF